MAPHPPPWQISLARLEGALPFLSEDLKEGIAFAGLRQLWHIHVRDYPFEDKGIEHNPGLDAGELVRSWYAAERRDFLSWISRRAPPPLASAASLAMCAKDCRERYTSRFAPAERALERLDALLPTRNASATLEEWISDLRDHEIDFLEEGSEVVEFQGRALVRPALQGAAWAASLAAAMRPHLFGFGHTPIVVAGLAPRRLFRRLEEESLPSALAWILAEAVDNAFRQVSDCNHALQRGNFALANLYKSSTAPQAWKLVSCLGPLTRAEIARAMGVTKRTSSQAVSALAEAGLVKLRESDKAILVASDR